METIPFHDVFPTTFGYQPRCLFKLGSNQYSFKEKQGIIKKKVVINSLPKSGTYMYARLLELAGLVNTNIHLAATGFWDFRDIPLSTIIEAPRDFLAFLALQNTSELIAEGQFAVGHIEYAESYSLILENFVHYFCVRDIRDALISHMRFLLDDRRRDKPTGSWWQLNDGPERFCAYLRGPGREYMNGAATFLPWLNSKNKVLCRFEEALGDYGIDAQKNFFLRFGAALELDGTQVDLLSVFTTQVIGKTTRTYSGARSKFAQYWSHEVDEALEEIGAHQANAILGYKEPPYHPSDSLKLRQ